MRVTEILQEYHTVKTYWVVTVDGKWEESFKTQQQAKLHAKKLKQDDPGRKILVEPRSNNFEGVDNKKFKWSDWEHISDMNTRLETNRG